MRLLFAISILLTSMQMASAEEEVLTPLQFQEGANAYEVEAISSGLSDLIKDTFEHWFSESHFIYPPRCSADVSDCRKNLDFNITFETATFDLNNDGKLEVIVYLARRDAKTDYLAHRDTKREKYEDKDAHRQPKTKTRKYRQGTI